MISFERRYEEDYSEYDWYFPSSSLCSLIESLTKKEDEILYVGCGTSNLGEELYKRGRRYVTNIDHSKMAIRTQMQRWAHLTDMQFVEMDATKLPRDLTGAFQLVVDKALLDYLLCDAKIEKSTRFLNEMKRVVKPGGWFCCVSHGAPESRVPMIAGAFSVSPSKIRVATIPKPHIPGFEDGVAPNYFVYIVQSE